MASIKVNLDYPIQDGMGITFRAPCDCSTTENIIISYLVITNSSSTRTNKTFIFKDAHLNTIANLDGFVEGAMVKVILDTVNQYAFIQNADTNAYLESTIGDIGTILDSINGEVV